MSETLLERLRQLRAVDRNAFDIYSDLQRKVDDKDLSLLFASLAKEEARHMILEKEIMSILQGRDTDEQKSA